LAKAPAKLPTAHAAPALAPAGTHPFGKKPLRTFAYAIALPALVLYVASVALVIVVLMMMAKDIDRLEDARDVSTMHAALDSFLNGLSDHVADEGTWNEAYLNVVVKPDLAWMDSTWGAAARLNQGYDTVLVTDSQGAIVFGENAVGPMKGDIKTIFPASGAILRSLDLGIAATGDATTVSRFAADKDGAAGLAAISIHRSTSNDLTVSRQTRRILWVAKHISPQLLQDLAVRYQTPVPRLVSGAGDGELSLRLADPNGALVGTIAWEPDRPSDAALNHSLLIATVVLFGIGLGLIFGLGQIRKSIVRRAAALGDAIEVLEQGSPTSTISTAIHNATSRAAEDDDKPSAIAGVSAADFEIEYQPVFDLRAETLIGAEALLRWRRPDKSHLLQEDLSPEERAALQERVGILAVRRAIDEIAPLLGMLLTVTVTAEQLKTGVFAEKITGTLGATGFPARRLQLAVPVAQLPPAEEIGPAIAGIRQSGVVLALSEFILGPTTTGYALPGFVDRIRLPQSIVSGIDADAPRLALVEATINVAKTAGFVVNVPGVSRKEEASKLLRLGCREFQGKLFAEPMPIAALTALILKPAAAKQAS
jgi:EAL domain-containing protein (putative c-di-GMP-specific phosphodiesterase class I)